MSAASNLSLVIEMLSCAWTRARGRGHRLLVFITGDERYEHSRCLFSEESDLNRHLPEGEVLTLSSEKQSGVLGTLWSNRVRYTLSWSHARARLGGSEAVLVIDLSEGCNPDAIGASLGSIRAGGLILILAPDEPPISGLLKEKLAVWPNDSSAVGHALWQRIWSSLKENDDLTEIDDGIWASHTSETSEDQEEFQLKSSLAQRECANKQQSSTKKTIISKVLAPDQESVLRQITLNEEQRVAIRVMINSHHRDAFTAVALTSSRGRGKSSVMGISAAMYLINGEREVWVTAPSEYACEALFSLAEKTLLCFGATILKNSIDATPSRRLSSSLGELRFVTPRALWMREEKPSLLLVDEAATLPVPLLERLLEHKPSLVFATTTQGYEGTGRGFSLRFRPTLQRALRKLYEPKLNSPLRWSVGDPAEVWASRALLLETSLPLKLSLKGGIDQLRYERFSGAELSQFPSLYEQVFALLVNAHYRTQPSDLWRMLDAPNLMIHLLSQEGIEGGQVVCAAALVSSEGELKEGLAAQLYEGRVRPRGQLFAANLVVHLNYEAGAMLKLARVVRIATLPLLQSRGIGFKLIEELKRDSLSRGVDLLGSSFGVTHQLLRFWLRAGFTPLRVSVRQSHVSGERSLLVGLPLSKKGRRLLNAAAEERCLDLEEQVNGSASDLLPELAFALLSGLWREREAQIDKGQLHDTEKVPASLEHLGDRMTESEWRALGAVAFSGRAYELASRPARRLALNWVYKYHHRLHDAEPLTPLGRLLMMKVVQGQRWLEVTHGLALGSTSEAMKGLSAALRCLYFEFAPSWALEWVKRFPQYDHPATLTKSLYPLSLVTNPVD